MHAHSQWLVILFKKAFTKHAGALLPDTASATTANMVRFRFSADGIRYIALGPSGSKNVVDVVSSTWLRLDLVQVLQTLLAKGLVQRPVGKDILPLVELDVRL